MPGVPRKEASYRYPPKLKPENAAIADSLIRLPDNHRNWRPGLCFLCLQNVRGQGWNHKRVHRIYREMELNLGNRPKRWIVREKPESLTVPEGLNEVWSMDCMHDQLNDGRQIRLLNVNNDYNRKKLATDVVYSLSAPRVIRSLDQIIESRSHPAPLRCDAGPEYISAGLQTLAHRRSIRIEYIQPSKPEKKASFERFNCTARYEWLAQYHLDTLAEAQDSATRWM
jgi:putative transposase